MTRETYSRDNEGVFHVHRFGGQSLSHAHDGGDEPHGYFGHSEDAGSPGDYTPWAPTDGDAAGLDFARTYSA